MSDNNKYIPYKLETHLTEICGEDPIYVNLLDSWHINKKTCLNLLSDVVFNYPHYTKHDISHSEAIITNIEMLLGEEAIRSLSPTDTWLLLNAAYLHDLGMVIDNKIIEQNWETQEFQDYLHRLENSNDLSLSESAKYINSLEKNLKDNKDVRAWPVRVRKAVTIIIADYYRSGHAKESQNYIQNMKNRLHIDLEYNGLIQHRLILLLSDIAYMHNEYSMKIFELDYNTNGFNADYAHPRFVALMLRMGDLLDADNNRFNSVNEIIFGEIPHSSQNHLKKHMSTRHILITPDKIEYRADCAEAEVYRETRNFLTWLKEEVEFWALNWKDIMPENINGSAPKLGKCELLLNGVPDIQGLSDLRFSMSSEKAFEIIEGANIYDDNFVFLREVIQNALDACKIRMWKDISEGRYKKWIKRESEFGLQPYEIDRKVFDNYEVEVLLCEYDNNSLKVIIKDNGVGLSIKQFKRICDVGKSYFNDKEKQQEINSMPIWLRPSAGFGIGLQSIFLVADYFEIFSKASNGEGIYARIESGKKNGYVQISRCDKLINQGTEIHIIIPMNFHLEYLVYDKPREFFKNKYDPFSLNINPYYITIWNKLREILSSTFFTVKIKFDGKIIDTINAKSFKKLKNKSNDNRYNYNMISNTHMELWDNKTSTGCTLSLEESKEFLYSKYYFKGMKIDNNFYINVPYILMHVDFYGLDTKSTLSLDRRTIKKDAIHKINEILKESILFYQDMVEKKIFEDKLNENVKYHRILIYNFWCGISLSNKKKMINNYGNIFNNIHRDILVLRKEKTKDNEQNYILHKMDFKEIISQMQNVAIIENYQCFMSGNGLKQNINAESVNNIMINSQLKCFYDVIVLDIDFAMMLSLGKLTSIQIINKDEKSLFLGSYSGEYQQLPQIKDKHTRNELIKSMIYKSNNIYKDNCLRHCIIGLDQYATLTTSEKPYGIGEQLHKNNGYIISPVSIKQWKEYKDLDKHRFIKFICDSNEFYNLLDYVFLHQYDKCKHGREEIKKEYTKLLEEIYDVCKGEKLD